MDLKQWAANGWLKAHATSPQEIGNLLAIVERDLQDASGDISSDWRFGIAYNAALKLATILLYAEGYRPERALQHYRTLQAIPLILGKPRKEDADYLDACRNRRNVVEYDCVGGVTNEDADELIDFVRSFREVVMAWLRSEHPNLLVPEPTKP